jgi:CheY-like chemotaxis protein
MLEFAGDYFFAGRFKRRPFPNYGAITERALRQAGLQVPLTRLADGQEAIDYFTGLAEAASGPDLVLLDVKMPHKDGFEVLRWLRQHPSYQKLPVMMLTSSDDPGDMRRARSLGADDFLTKKTNFGNVIETLRKFVLRSRRS